MGEYKVLSSFLLPLSLSLGKQHTKLPRKWAIDIFFGQTTLSHFYTLFLPCPTFSPLHRLSFSLSCSRSFMYRSEEAATYHRSLERLFNKSWRYMPDLTGHTHKDPSISLSFPSIGYPSLFLFYTHTTHTYTHIFSI